MGIVKNLKLRQPKTARIDFGRFYGIDRRIDGDVGGYNKASFSFNFSFKDGALKNGLGIASLNSSYKAPLGEVMEKIYFYRCSDYEKGTRDDRIIAFTTKGNMYSCPLSGGTFTKISGLYFNNQPKGVCYNYNGKDVIIFSAEGEGIKIYDGESVETVYDAPPVTSMCIHSERLFITSGGVDGALWFSDDFNPTNWNVSLSEAGFIDMSDEMGDMIGVVEFGGHLYVFRSYGISRVTAYSDQTEFSVSNVSVACGKILKNSVVVCGDYITFFATDGLYKFDGYSVTRISDQWFDVVETPEKLVKGVYFNGNVYYLLQLIEDSGEYHSAILKIDVDTNDYYFIVIAVTSDICVVSAEDEYKLLTVDMMNFRLAEIVPDKGWDGDNVKMFWRSKESDFGIKSSRKRLSKVSFFTKTDCELTVTVDGKPHSYSVTTSGNRTTVRPYLKGEKFTFEITVKDVVAEISGFTLEFIYY